MPRTSPLSLRLRIAALDEDWRAIHALATRAFAFSDGRAAPPAPSHRWSAADVAAHVGPVFVASIDGAPVGCVFGAAEDDAMRLTTLAVDASARGQGVARSLIDLAAWEAWRRGLARLTLAIRSELTPYAAFAALGFTRTGEAARSGRADRASMEMVKPVGAPPPPPPFSAPGDADTLKAIIRACPPLIDALKAARALSLPDWWVVSGALYNQVWNARTGRPDLHGVKDIDLFYFDPDTSWHAEDAVIRRGAARWTGQPPLEIRNQARVPLWYAARFGHAYPPVTASADAIARFACIAHAVGARLEADDRLTIHAPYGLDDIFSFRLRGNMVLPNRATHEAKAKRQRALWPELTVEPWPEDRTAEEESAE